MLSRVADSLYWMSRYLERAEHTARILDVHQQFTLELLPHQEAGRFRQVLEILQIEKPAANLSLEALSFSGELYESVVNCVGSARENGRQIREQISSEMFVELNRLYLKVRSTETRERWAVEPHLFYQEVKEGAHLFQGITDSTMTHGQGWHFIQAGRYLERAGAIASLLDVMLLPKLAQTDVAPDFYVELLGILKSCTAWEAYCKVYSAELESETMMEFLLLNREFPHALSFSVDQLVVTLRALAEATGTTTKPLMEPLIGRLQADLRYQPLAEILEGNVVGGKAPDGAKAFLGKVRHTLNQTHQLLYRLYLSEHYERSGL